MARGVTKESLEVRWNVVRCGERDGLRVQKVRGEVRRGEAG